MVWRLVHFARLDWKFIYVGTFIFNCKNWWIYFSFAFVNSGKSSNCPLGKMTNYVEPSNSSE